MHKLCSGENILNKYRHTEEEDRKLKNSSYRTEEGLDKEIDFLVRILDIPEDSRSELIRSMLKDFRNKHQGKLPESHPTEEKPRDIHPTDQEPRGSHPTEEEKDE